MDFNTFFNILLTGIVGFIVYILKERDVRNEQRHEKNEKAIKEMRQDMDRNFVTKDEHYRDINSLNKKIDDIKDILMDIKQDIGKLTGGKANA